MYNIGMSFFGYSMRVKYLLVSIFMKTSDVYFAVQIPFSVRHVTDVVCQYSEI